MPKKQSTYYVFHEFQDEVCFPFQDCLTPLSMQALPDAPESLCIAEMGGTEGRDGEPGVQGQLYLNIGLHNGVLLRTVLDQVTGDLSDTRTRYIGSRPVKLFRVTMQASLIMF